MQGDVFAASGLAGVVQLLRWNDVEQRFEPVRRLGALAKLSGVALDDAGRIWTPCGSWRWRDSCEAPLSLGDKEPDVHAQPIMLDGKTLCLLKKHYSYVQLAAGPCLDASGWSHLESRGVADFDLPTTVTGAAAVAENNSQSMVVALRSGEAFEIGITPDGKYFVQIGHGPYRIYELSGLGQAQRIAGTIDVDKEQILAAERQNLRRVAAKQTPKTATIPGTIRWDKSGKFRAEVELSVDAERLYLRYRVQDPSPWRNNGRDWTKLFATGDSVDLQFAADPQADPRRKGPVAGDKRLLIAPFDGQPIAVLYEHRKADGKNPIDFTSPWRGERVDNVVRLDDAQIEVKLESGGYEVKAAVLLADLGLRPDDKRPFRADFGVVFGDAEGNDANLRSYWSNQSTGLVDDIPGEIMLSPNLWGELRFE
ncbi:MAG: hypothetical protein KDA41_19460 [Planctomycetales bacterium]|nr:hypothetical protein [Planctomycetales bacterium]